MAQNDDNYDSDSSEDEGDDYGDAIVIDNGSYMIKAGFCGDDAPRCVFSAVVGRTRHQGVMVGMGGPSMGFSVGSGAKDINNFRDSILKHSTIPKVSTLSYNGIFYDYYFQTQMTQENKNDDDTNDNDNKGETGETKEQGNESKENENDEKEKEKEKGKYDELFYPSYCYARCYNIVNEIKQEYLEKKRQKKQKKKENDKTQTKTKATTATATENQTETTGKTKETKEKEVEYYLSCGLNSNMKASEFSRNILNLVIVLDISGSMSMKFNSNATGSNKNDTKLDIAKKCLISVLDQLNDNDRFGLILFNQDSIVFQDMVLLSEINVNSLKESISSKIRANGGTNFECGLIAAKKMFDNINISKNKEKDDKKQDDNDNIVSISRSNRIIYLTDMNPNMGATNDNELLGLCKQFVEKSNVPVYSTFIGVGIDFNTDLVKFISNVKGCNYYSVDTNEKFLRQFVDEFELMVTPLVFNLKLKVNAEGNSCYIDKVYGTGDENDDNFNNKSNNNENNENKENKENNASCEVMNIGTLFPSKSNENNEIKGGVILLKLKKKKQQPQNGREKDSVVNLEVHLEYTDIDGKKHVSNEFVTLDNNVNNKNTKDLIHFDNNGIRKAILLSKYVSLLKEWMNYRSVGKKKRIGQKIRYSYVFKGFLDYFNNEMTIINDKNLSQEIEILEILSNKSTMKELNVFRERKRFGGFGFGSATFCGDEALAKRGICSLYRPVENGIVTRWDDMEQLWRHCYFTELGVDPRDSSCLVTEAPLNPKPNREKTTQIFFESFDVPQFYLCCQSVLSLYASGVTTGVVLDCGYNVTHAVAIYEGYYLPHAVQRLYCGGQQITEYLKRDLNEKNKFMFTTSRETEIVSDIKEKLAYFRLQEEKEEKEKDEEKYELPDGTEITISKKKLTDCCEILFNPSMIFDAKKDKNTQKKTEEVVGIDSMICTAVEKCDGDIHGDLYKNIVLSGGGSLLKNIEPRLNQELTKKLSKKNVEFKVIAPPERKYSTWIGASILTALTTFEDLWITKDEYDEYGPAIVHRKCI